MQTWSIKQQIKCIFITYTEEVREETGVFGTNGTTVTAISDYWRSQPEATKLTFGGEGW